jgi:hypothetical protein
MYRFEMYRRITSKQLYDLTMQYLADLKLTYKNILFKFLDYIIEYDREYGKYSNREKHSNMRILKKYPQLKPFWGIKRPWPTSEHSVISNYDDDWNMLGDSIDPEVIRSITQSVPRPFNPSHYYVYFNDLNFFDQPVISMVDPNDKNRFLGSYVLINYSADRSETTLVLCLDVTPINESTVIQDDSVYIDRMKTMLPSMYKAMKTFIIQEDNERIEYEMIKTRIAELEIRATENCRYPTGALASFTYSSKDDFRGDNAYSLRKYLRKEIKKYGYQYSGYDDFVYYIKKSTQNGAIIDLTLLTAPMCRRIDPVIRFSGLGFDYHFDLNSYTPHTQADAEAYLDALMEFLREFEDKYLAAIGEAYPPSPVWYDVSRSIYFM